MGGQEPEMEKMSKITYPGTIILSFKVKDVFRNIKIGFTKENGC